MDKEQAKFLLTSFRPDGADAHLPEFEEALKMAAGERELGEWLAQERATDAAFVQVLNEVPIPDGLRDEILAVLEFDGQPADQDADLDSLFTGGLASIAPLEGLREQILTAMDLEKHQTITPVTETTQDNTIWRWLSVAAVAAAVAFLVTLNTPEADDAQDGRIVSNDTVTTYPTLGSVQPVAVHNAVLQMANKLTTPEQIELNTDLSCAHDAIRFLDTKEHPVPERLPAGLENAKLVGARDMYLDNNQPVSLLCFKKERMGMVHLIVVDSASVADADKFTSLKQISLKNCYSCSKTQFNIAHWRDEERIYMVLTKAIKEDMVKLF